MSRTSNLSEAAPIQIQFEVNHPGFSLDVDLTLPGRGVTGLFGPSGSGKTTCLRCMAGLIRPDRGRMRIQNETWLDTARGIALPTHRRALGYVFQEPSLFPHLTVLRNLRFGMQRVAPDMRHVDLDHATHLLGIDHLLGRMPHDLSGGERQRVGIARALLTSPRLLLMDEPLAALDQQRKNEILPYLQRLHAELAIPVIYVSHSTEEMARLVDHLVVLDHGREAASGPIGEMLGRLDLPGLHAIQATSVLTGEVLSHDAAFGLLTVRLHRDRTIGQTIRLVHPVRPAGTSMRMVVQARDVSLSLQAQADDSILNRLPAIVTSLSNADDPNHVMVHLDVEGSVLLARITRYSSERLRVMPGQRLYAQIKGISLLR